ncbi:hypothetical protein A2U01_0090548, partial [Trifolium medium]|nr:hypothetical protein [Trifolium medium]
MELCFPLVLFDCWRSLART